MATSRLLLLWPEAWFLGCQPETLAPVTPQLRSTDEPIKEPRSSYPSNHFVRCLTCSTIHNKTIFRDQNLKIWVRTTGRKMLVSLSWSLYFSLKSVYTWSSHWRRSKTKSLALATSGRQPDLPELIWQGACLHMQGCAVAVTKKSSSTNLRHYFLPLCTPFCKSFGMKQNVLLWGNSHFGGAFREAKTELEEGKHYGQQPEHLPEGPSFSDCQCTLLWHAPHCFLIQFLFATRISWELVLPPCFTLAVQGMF